MIGKILKLPFWIIARILCTVIGMFKFLLMILLRVTGFAFNHVSGTIFGALAGLLFGRNHVGVRLFTHHKKRHA
jgi:hypothetical protein